MTFNNLKVILTGHTCGDSCWHAKEDICHCSCGGVNHGILNKGGAKSPLRTSKKNGAVYVLHSVSVDYFQAQKDAELAKNKFPNAWNGWGGGTEVIVRKVTGSQAKWPEVASIGANWLVWTLMPGEKYKTNSEDLTVPRGKFNERHYLYAVAV